MATIIFGTGNLGRAIAASLVERGDPSPILLRRPTAGRHHSADLGRPDLVFDASRGDGVVENLDLAVAAGCRRFVVATTGWDDARETVDSLLRGNGASAVVAPNFSLGVALFLRLIEAGTELFGRVAGFDPYVVEWHRREKADRPSGTALEIARRILAAHPTKARIAQPDRAPAVDELEVVSLRAGASPGLHLVGFDAPGETVELRLTARDRSAYAAGALAAADWLCREPRAPGIHAFEPVVDDLLGRAAGLVPPAVPQREVAAVAS